MSDAQSIEDVLALADSPEFTRTSSCRILLNQAILAEHSALDAELRDMPATGREAMESDPRMLELAKRLAELEQRMESEKTEFRFRSIGRKGWQDLLNKHRPTRAQTEADKRTPFNPETFPAAAVAATCVSHPMTLSQAKELEQKLNTSQFDSLFAAAVDANVGGLDSPKSAAASMILGLNGASGRLPTTTSAPEVSSLDDA